MTIGEKILAFRAINDLSQTEFAKLCKLDRAYISDIENEKKVPGKIAKLKIEFVLDGEKINNEV